MPHEKPRSPYANRHNGVMIAAFACVVLLVVVGVWRGRITPQSSVAALVPSATIAPEISPEPRSLVPDPAIAPTTPPLPTATPTPTPVAMHHPPVPDAWLVEHGLDPLAANVLEQDADADGFTTLEEFNGRTDPNEPSSHPPDWTKLTLKRFVRVPFHGHFVRPGSKSADDQFTGRGSADDGEVGRSAISLNEIFLWDGKEYKFTKYVEKYEASQGFRKDVSEVILTEVATGRTIVLPKGQDVDSPMTYAVLTDERTHKEFAIRNDSRFMFPPKNGTWYKVVKFDDTRVELLDESSGTVVSIRAATR